MDLDITKKPHSNLILNAHTAVTAWKSAFLIAASVAAVSIWALVWMAAHQTVVLIPHSVASSTGPVKVNANTANQSIAYLGQLAISDLNLLLTWTPDTVGVQYSRALNRMDTRLFAAKQAELIKNAEQYRLQNFTSVFFPGPVELQSEGKVRVTGLVTRNVGEKQVSRDMVTYEITYSNHEGGIYVAGITTE